MKEEEPGPLFNLEVSKSVENTMLWLINVPMEVFTFSLSETLSSFHPRAR